MLAATLIFNALYFRISADEVFGIISLLLTVTLLSPALDLGTGRTAGRTIAMELAIDETANQLRNAVATLQITNFAIAILIASLLILAAPAVASDWLRSDQIPQTDIIVAIKWIAVAIIFLVPRNFVIACINGMKRQVVANLFGSAFAVLRGTVGLATMLMTNGALLPFLVVQVIVLFLECAVAVYLLWRFMPRSDSMPRVRFSILRQSSRFSLGDGAAIVIGTFMMHGDKLLLSALLPLSSFGAYALISTVATGIGRFTSPFSAAFLPHFVELFARNRLPELQQDYLVSTQLVSTIILPLAATLVAFSPEIVAGLLGEEAAFKGLPLAFSILVLATILNNLAQLPHGIQLAAGNSMTAMRTSAINAVIYLALIVILTPVLGMVGPAVGLFVVSLTTFWIMTRVSNRLMDIGIWNWISHSILRPLTAAIIVAGIGRLVAPSEPGLALGATWCTAVALAAMACAIMVSPGARLALRNLTGKDVAAATTRPPNS